MSNILKFKLGLILFSSAVLTLIPLLKSNFYAPVTIKKWQKLSWNDFQGFVKPFSKWGAVISSTVYLEMDSITHEYVAYAGQNNQYSWTTANHDDSTGSAYMLRHEQYHFNITELHARMMNQYLQKHNGKSESEYLDKLASIIVALNVMQNDYDEETDHSLIEHRQKRWEYHIDSLLRGYSQDEKMTTDYYSGASIFFPVNPEFKNQMLDHSGSYRSYYLYKYGMTLLMESYQYQSIEPEGLAEQIYNYYEKDSLEIKSFYKDTLKFELQTKVELYDSTNRYKIHALWVYDNNYVYKISAAYSYSSENLGYEEIVNSFINSFKIVNPDDYWISNLKTSNKSVEMGSVVKDKTNTKEELLQCITSSTVENSNGFFRGPIFHEEGDMIVVYDITEHADSLLFEKVLILEEGWYTYQPDSVDQFYVVPAERIPEKPFNLKFGYLLAKDTIQECFEFHFQSLHIDPTLHK